MRGISIEERAIYLAHYIIDSKDTVRETAAKFASEYKGLWYFICKNAL